MSRKGNNISIYIRFYIYILYIYIYIYIYAVTNIRLGAVWGICSVIYLQVFSQNFVI